MAIVPNLVRGEDGELRIVPETRGASDDHSIAEDASGPLDSGEPNIVFGTDHELAVHYCVRGHSFLLANNTKSEVEKWARQWVREDALRERTRLIHGESVAAVSPIVRELYTRSMHVFNEHSEPLGGTPLFRIEREQIAGIVSTLVGMRRHEEISALANLVRTISLRDFRASDDPFWQTHFGRVMLIWNQELKRNRLIEKQELWDRFRASGATMALNKFHALLKLVGLNGLPGAIRAESL
jgi:hypothetical protein